MGIEDVEIEVEYQTDTIGKYDLQYDGNDFLLIPKQTACLASENCGVPSVKQKIQLKELQAQTAGCGSGKGCC